MKILNRTGEPSSPSNNGPARRRNINGRRVAAPERGEGRNHDLWARGSADGRAFTLCVEARADEPFGDTIGETCAKAVERSEAPVLNRTSRSWWQRS